MKRFKLFLLTLFSCFFMILPTVNAEKMDFVDSKYPFSQLKSVYIYDIDLSALSKTNNNTVNADNKFAERVLLQDYYDNAHKFEYYTVYNEEQAKRKISLATNKDIDKMMTENKSEGVAFFDDNLKQIVQAAVKAELTSYYTDSYIIPAHTEWRTVTESEDYYDKNGKRHTRTRTIQVPEYVGDQTVYRANVTIHFSMIDTKTGKEIFSRTETRVNTFTSDCRECFKQTVRAFYRDLKKMIKK